MKLCGICGVHLESMGECKVHPNPNTHNTQQLSGPLGQIREIKGGKNLWIEENPLNDAAECRSLPYHLRCLTVSTRLYISTPKGLANHAESVSCYLSYGHNKTLWGRYSKSFFLYLLAASWQKLHSHFSSWHGLSSIQQLELGITGNALMDHIGMIGDEFGPMALPEKLGAGYLTLADFFSWNKKFLLEIVHNTCKNLPVEVHT